MFQRAAVLLLACWSALLVAAAPAVAGPVRLSVAASLTDALKEIAALYTAAHPGVEVWPNFGASGALAKQIAQGAPADIFISANPKWMEYLVEQGRIAPGQTATLAYNTLVFVGRPGLQVAKLADLPGLQRIAMGSPKSVPAGQYAEQALKAAGLAEPLAGKLVLAQDVRQALVYADRGETDGAFVYRTDALLAKEAKILFEVPRTLYDPVSYPLGLTQQGAGSLDAVGFFDFLTTPTARAVLLKYGFVVK
jgi:molybdate transport system substrate-binding protein